MRASTNAMYKQLELTAETVALINSLTRKERERVERFVIGYFGGYGSKTPEEVERELGQ